MQRIFKITSRERRIRRVYLVSFILLFLCYLVTVYANQELVKQSNTVKHTNRLINALDNLLETITDAETGMRGYLLSKDTAFLLPYKGTQNSADSLLSIADELSSDHLPNRPNIGRIRNLIDRRFNILAFNIKNFDANNQVMSDSILNLQRSGRIIMDSIRSEVKKLEKEEEQLLAKRESQLNNTMSTINIVTLITLALVFSLLFFGFITYSQVSWQRKTAEQDILDYQDELNRRINALDKANAELIKMRSLEKFAVTGRIARTIGHEVRNPLTNIMLASDQLKLEMGDAGNKNKYLFEMIERNSARINQLISDLLNSTKASELNYQKIAVAELVEETLSEALDRFKLTKVKLVRNFKTGDSIVSVDKDKMKIALLNLVTNALEALEGKEGGELEIGILEAENKILISISDNGPGMNEETVSRIFEPYYTTKKMGNGLGLTNTQNIILGHKGEITVESTLGQGTVFKIYLNKELF